MKRRWIWGVLGGLLMMAGAWNGYVFWLMSQPPEQFARGMAKIPQPLIVLTPFPLLWNVARAGVLTPGDPAPDFELERADWTATVRLSAHRGVRPVVLVFGSYT